jgi:hypothetical protein
MEMRMEQIFEAIKANLFPASHAAIGDWNSFLWHRDGRGVIQTHKLHSSQALAIDVFGTIKVSEERDRILGALARKCGVPDDGPWTIELEWIDPDNRLHERTRTQVDAIAFGKHGLLVFEGKFMEVSGVCSQPKKRSSGPHRNKRQCNGKYEMQTNPVNDVRGRCALREKDIRYWDSIPRIYGIDASLDHRPCPFKGEAFQWMRNVVLTDILASALDLSGAVVARLCRWRRVLYSGEGSLWPSWARGGFELGQTIGGSRLSRPPHSPQPRRPASQRRANG